MKTFLAIFLTCRFFGAILTKEWSRDGFRNGDVEDNIAQYERKTLSDVRKLVLLVSRSFRARAALGGP